MNLRRLRKWTQSVCTYVVDFGFGRFKAILTVWHVFWPERLLQLWPQRAREAACLLMRQEHAQRVHWYTSTLHASAHDPLSGILS